MNSMDETNPTGAPADFSAGLQNESETALQDGMNEDFRESESVDTNVSFKELDRAREELKEANDKHLRLYAEFENFRRRTARESFELMATANARLITKLLEVVDNFDRAFDSKNKGTLEDFEKGMRLIQARFKALLEDEGLEAIDPGNAAFDPELHEALLQQVSETIPDQHVVQVVEKGYKLKAKILKHAKVIVSRGKE